MDAIEKFTMANWTDISWRAVYTERCTYGSGEDSREPIVVIQQGTGFLSHSMAFRRAPSAILCRSRASWKQRLSGEKDKLSKDDSDHGIGRSAARSSAAAK